MQRRFIKVIADIGISTRFNAANLSLIPCKPYSDAV